MSTSRSVSSMPLIQYFWIISKTITPWLRYSHKDWNFICDRVFFICIYSVLIVTTFLLSLIYRFLPYSYNPSNSKLFPTLPFQKHLFWNSISLQCLSHLVCPFKRNSEEVSKRRHHYFLDKKGRFLPKNFHLFLSSFQKSLKKESCSKMRLPLSLTLSQKLLFYLYFSLLFVLFSIFSLNI